MPGYTVGIRFETEPGLLDADGLASLVETVLEAEEAPDGSVVGVLFTDDEGIRAYNQQYRGIDAATDVLSFEMGNDEAFAGDDANELGDIVVSLESALRQAQAHSWTLQQEVAHLVVHATLHLCGHDHEESPEAEGAMRAREERYLGPLANVHS